MVGERLRTERERQNLSLRDIEKGTSIRAHYLEAIENGDFKALPGEVYAKGFVRNYATFLQMDANAAVKEFQDDLHGAANAPDKGKSAKAKPKDAPKKTNLKKDEPAKEPPKQQAEQGQAKPATSPEGKQEASAATSAKATEETKDATQGHDAPFEAYQEEQTESSHKKRNAVVALVLLVIVVCGAFFMLNNDAASEHGGQPAKPVQPVQQTQQQPQQPQAQPQPAPAPAPQPPKPEGVELQLSFTDPCWTQVIVDGKNEFEGTVEGGKQLSFKGKDEIKLTGGNAGGVTVTVNGQNQGPLGEAGQVVEKSFKAEKPATDAQQGQPQQPAEPAANANAN